MEWGKEEALPAKMAQLGMEHNKLLKETPPLPSKAPEAGRVLTQSQRAVNEVCGQQTMSGLH